jgi:hypothetical protein
MNGKPLGFPPEIDTQIEFPFRLEKYTGGLPDAPDFFRTAREAFADAIQSEDRPVIHPFRISNIQTEPATILWEATDSLLAGPRGELFQNLRNAASA